MSSFPLYLMRHGAPVLAGRLLGRTDCDVTDDGIAACVERVRGLTGTSLIASDLIRARRCAEAIGTPVTDPRWRELDFGVWDGHAPADIDAAEIGRFWNDPDTCPPPGGERWSALVARVGAAIEALPTSPTLVVTHGGAMRAALSYLCGLSHASAWAFDLPCSALLTLTVWKGARRRGQVTGLRT